MNRTEPAGERAGVNRAGAARGEEHLLAALRGELAQRGVRSDLEQRGLWSRLRVHDPAGDPMAGFDHNVIVAFLGGQRCYCWPRAIPIGPATQLTHVADYIAASLTQAAADGADGKGAGGISSLTVQRLLRDAREDLGKPVRRPPRPPPSGPRAPRTAEVTIPAAAGAPVTAPRARSKEIMAVTRDLAGTGATPAQIAAKAGANPGRITQAMAVLRDAPDLADAVTAGCLTLGAAYRNTRARTHAAPGLATVSYVTVAEMAGLLRVSPATVYRRIASGDLDAIRARTSLRIPAPAARQYLASHTVTAPAQSADRASPQGPAQPGPCAPAPAGARRDQERLLAPGEVAVLFGVDPKTVTTWADRGLLPSARTPGGHRRYRDTDVAALLTGTNAATLSVAEVRAILREAP